ncbi:MAG: hypothetical protein IJ511_00320 [Bacteroides sp.]|nr:hypothetical protein [Bacteroides sp.]
MKRYIAYFLILVSIVMLIVPVLPHHHHQDGLMCMKNDITADCCAHHHQSQPEEQPAGNDHCCCNTGCLTNYFVQQTPCSDDYTFEQMPQYIPYILYIEPLLDLFLSESSGKNNRFVYIESLHGTFITRAAGLRAPPSLLA